MADNSSMKNDAFYAEMINLMRAQGSKDNPVTLQLGVMLSPNSVKVDDLTLNSEDLYIADYLIAGHTYELVTPYVTSVTFGHYDGSYTVTDKGVRSVGLKKGDLVAVQKLHNTNKYVILARVKGA